MGAHHRLGALGLAAALACAGCSGRSSPTAPGDTAAPAGNAITYRGTVAASPEMLASGLRIVAGSGTAPVGPGGQFEIVVNDATVRLRLVGPDLDVPIVLVAAFQSNVVELHLRVDRGGVTVVSTCGVTISTGPTGVRLETRLCAG